MVLVGTNGFQYRDWAGVFYPSGLGAGHLLEYYSRHFGCCELGFTYYRIPEVSAVAQLVEGAGRGLQFVFRVPFKLLDAPGLDAALARRFAAALWPLKETGLLSGVVARFPPAFAFIRGNFDRLCRLRDALEGIQLVAEFGCADWRTPRSAKHLRAARIALACVDGGEAQQEKVFYCATANLAYVRFEGRNRCRWLEGDGSAQHDYLYSRAELAAAVPEIRRLEEGSERVLVLMNNPWRGQATVNARMMIELLADKKRYTEEVEEDRFSGLRKRSRKRQ